MITTKHVKQFIENQAADLVGHTDTEKHIFRKGVIEFLEGLSDDVNYPAILIERADFNYTDSLSDNIMKTREMAIMVVDHAPDPSDTGDIENRQESCEIIADKILNRMQEAKHYERNEAMQAFSFNNVNGSEIQNVGDSNYGVIIEIELSNYHNQYEL